MSNTDFNFIFGEHCTGMQGIYPPHCDVKSDQGEDPLLHITGTSLDCAPLSGQQQNHQ